MNKWIRTSWLSIQNPISLREKQTINTGTETIPARRRRPGRGEGRWGYQSASNPPTGTIAGLTSKISEVHPIAPLPGGAPPPACERMVPLPERSHAVESTSSESISTCTEVRPARRRRPGGGGRRRGRPRSPSAPSQERAYLLARPAERQYTSRT